ncbi:PTS sugar transporter subunit IIA [Clostridium vincentii]|uniref:Ascorbate-specific phosphotransferase enzyme IIA component n=1 Tax=Clostridium vincentii TaxID=52704 RepID=A0A2T0BDX8_9CLOT|nr:PTS sugar transporter subunit IIA [Clostridium vincentii]PRR82017.1 Ascorbate-specific phosphotransferase enzyme IIA component [Clostridium vincentii]
MIEELLKEEIVDLNVQAIDWVDAVKAAGNLLVKDGKVEEMYVDAMINTVKQMGAYIVMAPGVAMPHARPEAGVKELGISVITLKTPVPFGNEGFDPVKLIFSICAKDSKEHINLLQDLSCILDDSELIEKCDTCRTKKELIDLIIKVYKKNK